MEYKITYSIYDTAMQPIASNRKMTIKKCKRSEAKQKFMDKINKKYKEFYKCIINKWNENNYQIFFTEF